jgi:hypothetical protein
VQFWSLGKEGECGVEETCVSHDSHRVLEKGCAKRTGFVDSAGRGAWDKGTGETDVSQGAKIKQILSEGDEGWIWVNSHRR